MSIQSIYPDICANDLAASRGFYTDLLGLEVTFESDWYVALQAADQPSVQLALVAAGHSSVPTAYRTSPGGVLISFEVDDATAFHDRALELGLVLAQPLRDEEFGQRHFIAVDPDGLLVDVIETLFVPDSESS